MKNKIPIIECGHGGMIDGIYQTKGKKYYEFDSGKVVYEGVINRTIGKMVIDKLKSKGIFYIDLNTTNQADTPIWNRIRKINSLFYQYSNAYLISLHSNAASESLKGEGSKATGFEILVYNYPGLSFKLAEIAKSHYENKFPGVTFRGIKTRNDLALLRKTICPAILLENLFFDNEREANYLTSDIGQDDISDCIVDIIKEIYNTDI